MVKRLGSREAWRLEGLVLVEKEDEKLESWDNWKLESQRAGKFVSS